jgi:RHS repeat-associated protein
VYSKEAYAPFGETYNEAVNADRSFTGQDQDVVTGSGGTGAYDFLYRKHDPSAGRWLSPDPYGWSAVDQTNPQTLNRYAYVMNDPLGLIDQLGLCVSLYAFIHNSGPGTQGTWSLQGYFYYDNGLPCAPPSGCQPVVNANGAFQGMQCNTGNWANMGAYCAMNNCPTGPGGSAPSKLTLPQVCGGTFAFAGGEADGAVTGAFAGGIVEADSQEGITGGSLVEAWAGGEGPVIGAGKITSPSDRSVLQGFLGFTGVGLSAGPLAGLQIGYVAGKGWGGLYIEGHVGPIAVGTGGYLSSCKKGG